jgi:hypothetical protein
MVHDGERGPRPHSIAFDPAARERWVAWVNAFRAEMRHEAFPASLRGPYAKLEGYAARIALTVSLLRQAYEAVERQAFEAVDEPTDRPGDVTAADVAGAIQIVEYFKAHTQRVRAHLACRSVALTDDAEAIIRWVRNTQREEFSERDAKKNFERRFGKDPLALADALQDLRKHDLVRPVPPEPATGRPRSPVYRVNPYLLDPQNGQNPQNEDEIDPDPEGDFADDDPQNRQNPQNEDELDPDPEGELTDDDPQNRQNSQYPDDAGDDLDPGRGEEG